MKKKLMNYIKYIKAFYHIYIFFGTLFIKILRLFVKENDKLILFASFGGRNFDDSPKAIYDLMITDSRYQDYEFVWGFREPEKFSLPTGRKVKTDSFQYFVTALKAKCWVTNASVNRGLGFKGKSTFYFNTWHGTPIKKMGIDFEKRSEAINIQKKNMTNIMLAQGNYDVDIFSRAFNIEKAKFQILGLPRNDKLANYTEEERCEIRKALGIPSEKKAILYMPTFREYNRTSSQTCFFDIPIDFEKMKKAIGSEYVFLFRVHYEVLKVMNLRVDDFCINVSDYPSLNDLMIASDILISDYSSVFFDYSIMAKPMLCFAYDYDEYALNRGMYFDIRQELPSADSQEELVDLINCLPDEAVTAQVTAFKNKFVTAYGNATEKSLDCIYHYLKGAPQEQ